LRTKLKVLHVYKTYYPDTDGGIEMVLEQLMQHLQPLDVESRLLVLSRCAEPVLLQRKEGEIIRCPTSMEIASNPMSWRALSMFRKLASWADVLHYQFPWPFADLLHLLSSAGKPFVVSYQSDIVKQRSLMQLYRPLMMHFLNQADYVCASSPAYTQTSKVLTQLHKPAIAIANGIDASRCPPASTICLERWHHQVGQGFFLFVGVLRYYKGLHTLIRAAALNGLSVVIAGSGPESERLHTLAQTLGAHNVQFVGRISDEDKSALLALCQGFVFPSHMRSEAFGMSLVEASIYSKPMISCEIGTGTSYVNLHEETGYVVPPEDVLALSSAMQRLHDAPEQAQKFGQQARQRYETHFTATAMALQYRAIYDKVVTRN
jgi:glycosyltransferase involved in cell wall biosynthesis